MHDVMLLSSSYVYKSEYLAYCLTEVLSFIEGCTTMLFVPFAYDDHEQYTDKVKRTLGRKIAITGAHTLRNKPDVSQFDVIFCGGGNTFLLLSALYKRELLTPIRDAVLEGTRYLGSSAGANVACPSIGTTNDMPIVYPPSFEALNLVPFNINPHYFETPPDWTQVGETRRARIREFIQHNHRPVIGLEEGAILLRRGSELFLRGIGNGRIFAPGLQERVVSPGEALHFLLSTTP
jgi:dipeptidase E